MPARAISVAWFARDRSGIVLWLEGLLETQPACMREVKAQIDGQLQASLAGVDQGIVLFHGRISRDRTEACLREVAEQMGMPVSLQRDGQITAVSGAGGETSAYMGWTEDHAVVWHEDRAIVEEILTGSSTLESNPDMLALLERVNTGDPVWAVGIIDLTQLTIGVPSYGAFFSGDIFPPADGSAAPPLYFTFIFASAEDAFVAANRVEEAIHNPRFSETLREVMLQLRPERSGAEARVDMRGFLGHPEVIAELAAARPGAVEAAAPSAPSTAGSLDAPASVLPSALESPPR